MLRKRIPIAAVAVALAALASQACGGGTGACVSDTVEFTFGLRVYCYSNFSKGECSDYDAQQINGASNWFYHAGQTCGDRDLVEGSNPWP